MEKQYKTKQELYAIADKVVNLLRPEGLSIAEARDVLKYADENLEYEPLSKCE